MLQRSYWSGDEYVIIIRMFCTSISQDSFNDSLMMGTVEGDVGGINRQAFVWKWLNN